MATRALVPILLLTGFPGSGKTSLLARWLKSPDSAPAAPGAGLTIIARGVPAQEIANFNSARLAISAMQATTHSTGARA